MTPYLHYLFFVPALLAALYVIVTRIQLHEYGKACVFASIAVILGFNVVGMTMFMQHSELYDSTMHLFTYWSVVLILPVVYIFVCQCIGQKFHTHAGFYYLWICCLLLLIPQINIFRGDNSALVELAQDAPKFSIIIYENGVYDHHISYLGFILILQMFAFLSLMYNTYRSMRHYGIIFSSKTKIFAGWMVLGAVFFTGISLIPQSMWQNRAFFWIYFIGYALQAFYLFLMMVHDFDKLAFLQSNRTPLEMDLNAYVKSNEELCAQLRYILFTEKAYLHEDMTTEDVAKRMGISSLKLDMIAKRDVGMTFQEYLAVRRKEEGAE